MFHSWKNDVGQEPCCRSQIFVHLLVPLVGNVSNQAHSSSYQGYILPGSLILGTGSRGTLWQELYFSCRSCVVAHLSLMVDKIWNWFQCNKGKIQLPYCFHIAIFSTFPQFTFILPSWPNILWAEDQHKKPKKQMNQYCFTSSHRSMKSNSYHNSLFPEEKKCQGSSERTMAFWRVKMSYNQGSVAYILMST